MGAHIYWLIAGFLFVIAELITGTFYLLILGVAAFAVSLIAFLGLGIEIQAVVAAAVAIAGVAGVNRYRGNLTKGGTDTLETGQRVEFESWVNEKDGLAKVKFRGAVWDARMVGEHGDTSSAYYVCGIDSGILHISLNKPA